MAFYFYRKYKLPELPTTKWEAMQIIKKIEQGAMPGLNHYLDSEWIKLDEAPSGWQSSIKKQLFGNKK